MMKLLKHLVVLFLLSILISTHCDPSHSYFIKNNTNDTLHIMFHSNRKYLDYTNCSWFSERFNMIVPNDSVDYRSSSLIFDIDHFLIIVDDDTLSKYATFEDVVRLKKYKEIYFSKDSLNNMKCIVISEEMIK